MSVDIWLKMRTRFPRGQKSTRIVEPTLAAIGAVRLCFHIQFKGMAHLAPQDVPIGAEDVANS